MSPPFEIVIRKEDFDGDWEAFCEKIKAKQERDKKESMRLIAETIRDMNTQHMTLEEFIKKEN